MYWISLGLGKGSGTNEPCTWCILEAERASNQQLSGLSWRLSQVPPTSYGLSILDVLRLPDKDLNQVVGMKRLAPYREDGGATRPNYGKLRELQVGILLL